jgi:hypothetical protein
MILKYFVTRLNDLAKVFSPNMKTRHVCNKKRRERNGISMAEFNILVNTPQRDFSTLVMKSA